LRADHVIEDLLGKLGASVRAIEAPFTPEGGGYGDVSRTHMHQPHGHAAKPSIKDKDESANAALYRLMTWLSSAYPVGAFSYSHGIEYAVEAGLVRDRASLTEWIAGILLHGSGAIDGALFAAAWRAAKAADA